MSDVTDKDGFLIQVKEIDPFNAKEFQDKKPLIRYQLGTPRTPKPLKGLCTGS